MRLSYVPFGTEQREKKRRPPNTTAVRTEEYHFLCAKANVDAVNISYFIISFLFAFVLSFGLDDNDKLPENEAISENGRTRRRRQCARTNRSQRTTTQGQDGDTMAAPFVGRLSAVLRQASLAGMWRQLN